METDKILSLVGQLVFRCCQICLDKDEPVITMNVRYSANQIIDKYIYVFIYIGMWTSYDMSR